MGFHHRWDSSFAFKKDITSKYFRMMCLMTFASDWLLQKLPFLMLGGLLRFNTQPFPVSNFQDSIPSNPYTEETTCTWTEVTKLTLWRFKNGLCQCRVLQQNEDSPKKTVAETRHVKSYYQYNNTIGVTSSYRVCFISLSSFFESALSSLLLFLF